MEKYFLDAGTTWSKILTVKDGKKAYSIIRTKDLSNYDVEFEISTGHTLSKVKTKKTENEVIALSFGAKEIKNGVILDLGSRDAKWVKFENGKFKDMDWNTNCASSTGATVEMLLKFYEINSDDLIPTNEKYNVTCGIFGLEKIMDDISNGIDSKIAISKFITGIANNAYNFTKKPDKIYLSGGFCENSRFTDALKFYTKVELLGRFVLVDGLYNIYSENLFKGRFDKKIKVTGPDYLHDPSGEELIIEEID